MTVNYLIEIVVVNGRVYFKPYSRQATRLETVEWKCAHQFYLRFAEGSPFSNGETIIQSTQLTPGNWTSGRLQIDADPDRYPYEGYVMWANPERKNAIEPIHHFSPDIIIR